VLPPGVLQRHFFTGAGRRIDGARDTWLRGRSFGSGRGGWNSANRYVPRDGAPVPDLVGIEGDRTVKFLCLVLAAAVAGRGASLGERIYQLIDAQPISRQAFWGIQVIDLASGKTIYELNANRFFVPASNTKLFTTALALTRLGPDFTFQTRVLAN